MSQELTLPASFGNVPSVFQGGQHVNDELGAGVASSYAVLGYRGKVWALKYQGNESPLMRDDGDGPRNSLEVVLVKASPAISKIYYKSGYVDGSNQAPDCWSSNGVAPDPSVQNKVSPACANCPMNAWGSRTTEAGKQAKACADSRRTAVVPLADINNEAFGGPMLLRIPAASLKDLKAYGDLLNSYQFPYYGAATRISFDPQEAFPKFQFAAIRPLQEHEARMIAELREGQAVKAVLQETAATVVADAPVVEKPPVQSIFEQYPAATTAAPVAKPAPKPQPAPTAATVAQPKPKQTTAAATDPFAPKTAAAPAAPKPKPAVPKTSPFAAAAAAQAEDPSVEQYAGATEVEEASSEDEAVEGIPEDFDAMLESLLPSNG